jgi:hypothetical protein
MESQSALAGGARFLIRWANAQEASEGYSFSRVLSSNSGGILVNSVSCRVLRRQCIPTFSISLQHNGLFAVVNAPLIDFHRKTAASKKFHFLALQDVATQFEIFLWKGGHAI